MSEKIVEAVARAIRMHVENQKDSLHLTDKWAIAARAAIDAYKREIAKTVPTVEYFEGCPVDQLDETAYRRYLAYKRDPQNHLRMYMWSPSP